MSASTVRPDNDAPWAFTSSPQSRRISNNAVVGSRRTISFCKLNLNTSYLLDRKTSEYPFRRPLPPGLTDAILLAPDAPPLTPADAALRRPLLLLDASWHHAAKMRNALPPVPLVRSLPAAFRTAYPRSSKIHDDPPSGLATVEALHAALSLLGRRDDALLAHYPFAPAYLSLNAPLLPASKENASP